MPTLNPAAMAALSNLAVNFTSKQVATILDIIQKSPGNSGDTILIRAIHPCNPPRRLRDGFPLSRE